jgi:uncharacterized protein RhaS with RHS repeats
MQARYYDPVLGRFLSPDPVGFAQGGVRYFNRYGYTANDPVNATDPDGKEVRFNFQTTKQIFQTVSALSKIASTPSGRAALSNLDTSSNVHIITVDSNLRGNGIDPASKNGGVITQSGAANSGVGSSIYWNPDLTTGGVDDSGNRVRDPAIGLGHEIGHASDLDDGTHPPSEPYKTDANGYVTLQQTPSQETGSSMKIENEMRANDPKADQRSYYVQ